MAYPKNVENLTQTAYDSMRALLQKLRAAEQYQRSTRLRLKGRLKYIAFLAQQTLTVQRDQQSRKAALREIHDIANAETSNQQEAGGPENAA